MRLRRFKPSNQSGFTLLETLVAFALLAISITVIYRVGTSIIGNSLRQTQLYTMTEFARSQLDEIVELGSNRPRSGTYRDTWDWRTTIEPVTELPATYLDKTHYVAHITIHVTPANRDTPAVTLFAEDFRKLP